MTDGIMDRDKVVVVGKPAWHELGQNFNQPICAVDAHTSMGGSFDLFKKQVGVMFDDEFIKIPNSFAIVRGATNKDPQNLVFGYATDHYHIIQPIDILKAFDAKVGVSIETLGFIQDGRKLFVTWKMPNFEVVTGDEIELYGQVMMGFDTVFSSRLNIGTVRIVCANTFSMALAEENQEKKENRGRGTIYSSKHTNAKLLHELGEWMGYIQENAENQANLCKSLFKKFADAPILHEQQAKDLLVTSWADPSPVPDFYPDSLRESKQAKIDAEAEKVEKIRDGIYDLFTGSQGIAIDETYWGLFNAGTQYFNHVMPSKKDTNYSIVWGNRSNEMNHFAEVLRNDLSNQ
jgi:hypothetical protein